MWFLVIYLIYVWCYVRCNKECWSERQVTKFGHERSRQLEDWALPYQNTLMPALLFPLFHDRSENVGAVNILVFSARIMRHIAA